MSYQQRAQNQSTTTRCYRAHKKHIVSIVTRAIFVDDFFFSIPKFTLHSQYNNVTHTQYTPSPHRGAHFFGACRTVKGPHKFRIENIYQKIQNISILFGLRNIPPLFTIKRIFHLLQGNDDEIEKDPNRANGMNETNQQHSYAISRNLFCCCSFHRVKGHKQKICVRLIIARFRKHALCV